MIKIAIYRDRHKLITGYDVLGHAETQDIVCAGISALTQSAVMGLDKHLGANPLCEAGHGKLTVRLSNPDQLTNAILRSMEIGLLEIKKLYPEFVQITTE